MYMDDIKVFGKKENELETLTQTKKIIQPGYKNRIRHRNMCNAHNEK